MPEQQTYEMKPLEVDLEKGDVTPLRVADDGTGKSEQPEEASDVWTPDDALRPPEDLEAVSKFSEHSQVRKSVIGAIARNTFGLGWTLEPEEPTADPDKNQIAEATNLLDKLAEADPRLDRPTFADLLYAVKTDEEECGNAAIEVSRNQSTGQIDGLYHVLGKRVRRKRDRSGYVIGPKRDTVVAGSDEVVEFYNFGEKVKTDDSGKATGELHPKRSWDTNELIRFRLYTSESRDYGLPRDIGLAIEYLAAKYADEWNVGFFGSSGTPPSVLFVTADERKEGNKIVLTVPAETVQRVTDTLRSDGRQNRRVAIIPMPAGASVDHVQLGRVSDRDMGFQDFRSSHRRAVLGAFRTSPIFVADVEDAGRYTAEVERAITLEQVFDPEQRRYEERIHRTILRDLGLPLKIKFKRLAVEGDAARRDSADRLADAGAIEKGELRDAHGWGPLSESAHGEGINTELVDLSAAAAAPPVGPSANGRVVEGTDQRGLRPGVGGRVQKSDSFGGKDDDHHRIVHVEEEVGKLRRDLESIPTTDE